MVFLKDYPRKLITTNIIFVRYEIQTRKVINTVYVVRVLFSINNQNIYKGDWGTRLQENPQFILQFVIMIQLISRRILRDQNEAPEGMFYIIYWVCILSVRVSVIGAILVCLSITLVILEQAQAAPEYRFAVQGWCKDDWDTRLQENPQ